MLIHKTVGYVSGQAEDGYQPAITLVTPETAGKATARTSAFPSLTCASWRRPDVSTSIRRACWS
ncbi:MAG: Pseudouridine synthase [uncultured Paraburkholderia sp.]|nr:MAG: Pseudouridine synthase [uncultured Paraburkholderia sp.]